MIWLICRVAEKPMLGCFNPKTEEFRIYDPAEYGVPPLPDYEARQATITPDGTPWFALDLGLVKVDTSWEQPPQLFTIDSKGNYLSDAQSITADSLGRIWVSFGSLVGCYDPATDKLRRLPFSQLGKTTVGGAVTLPSGQPLFATYAGLIAFSPDIDSTAISFPPLVIDKLVVEGTPYNSHSPLTQLRELSLLPQERNVTIGFTAISFSNQQSIKYAYRTDGGNWNNLGTSRSLSFTDRTPR
ncbi:MAG: hypothetical protein AAF597_21150, partial [Bacteroidota bacterium]